MEGQLRHCEKRTELILKQLEENDVQKEDTDCADDEDEVSFIYYGENCTCSKNSMCKSKKCLCFLKEKNVNLNAIMILKPNVQINKNYSNTRYIV